MTLLLLLSPVASASPVPVEISLRTVELTQELGDLVRATALVTSLADDEWPLVDPITVTARVKPPKDDPAFDVAVVRDGEGRYHADFNITRSGVWRYKFTAAGGFEGASEDGMFHVMPSAF